MNIHQMRALCPEKWGFGFAGAQRTGKTTLARRLAEETHTHFQETSASGTFKRLGADPKAEYSFPERFSIQQEILIDMEIMLEEVPRVFVSDRTPLDVAAYTLADVTRANFSMAQEVLAHRQECLRVTERFFHGVCVVQPGIPVKDDYGKAPGNESHMEHINSIILGMMIADEVSFSTRYLCRHVTDLDMRVEESKALMYSELDLKDADARKHLGTLT